MAENRRKQRSFGRRGNGEKARDFKGTIKKLIGYMADYKMALFLVGVFAIGSTTFNVIGPKILGNATTKLFEGIMLKFSGQGAIDFEGIFRILIFLMTIYVISACFSFVQGWLMTGISQKMCLRMRRDISQKINRMPLAYFEKNKVGDVLSRITNDVDTMGASLNQSVTQLITSTCTIVGVLIMMLTISPIMTVITIVVLPLSMALVLFMVKKSQKYFVVQQKYLGQIDGQIEETFSGLNIVKAFNRQDKEIEAFNATNEVLYESAWKSQFLSGLMMPVMNFISNLGYVAVAISGAMLAASGTIMVGDIVSFVQYVKRFTQPITQLSQVSNMLQSMAAAAERIFEFLDQEEEVSNVSNAANKANLDGHVTFSHVSFGYNEDKLVIKDFNCDIEKGKMVAIVGPTGAGKTTIVKLLMRFYDVNKGSIKIGNVDIKDYDRADLRAAFGMVLQDTWLFKGSIMENIRYGRLDATDEEVIEAAKAARADNFIRALPDGYQMELNEEATNISQGQKQLITIARAILANKPILIFDEATSSVDTRTERLIQKAMNTLMLGRTSFVIAHRLSTIRDADVILVLKDGDIVEQGSHDQLIEKGGFYASLYNSQFENA